MNNHDKAREQVRAQFGDSVDFSPGTSGYALAELIEGHLDKLDELRRELDLTSWPSVEHANAMLKAAATEHAQLVAEGTPPLKPHEILAVFREAGCLYERKYDASDRERRVLEAAERVRDGRYSVKTALTREDRTLFDEFNAAVDALRYPEAK